MGKFRGNLYKAARILGDVEAVSKGKAGKRIQRRVAGKMAGKALKSSGCYIATACYGSPLAKEIEILSRFRDQYLLTNIFGRIFVRSYYLFSRRIAEFVGNNTFTKKSVRAVLTFIISRLKWKAK